ncbi:NAD dependent epimerase/dehydratase [Colletotrichum karsti]|uniref:NAD dependent epimerase/dehydratase n=1 Tax=Colletotrichum karsti TaxID=1095194 RepID=A0A9P6HY81_9PEZI|nr:NAD dependent epimerase/dehydratase [Colletotrichum karsti]KAF9872764.1 NAD dependent epimerase/dehydratase [Colletotrichum karsti]
MHSEESFGIPEGSTVLVTGVNGFIGSHICSQLLQLGFDVRGTVRDVTKYAWVEDLMERENTRGCFTLVSLPDLEEDGAFDSLVDGVSAVIHVASPVSLSPDPESVIPSSINGALNALKAANRSPSVKRFVLTSSSVAAALPKPGQKGEEVTTTSWNIESVAVAWGKPHPHQAWHVYAASKIEAERAVWKFYNQDKSCRPDLVVNTVLPSCNFGKSLDVINQGHPSTSSFIESLWYGINMDQLACSPPQHFVDVEDTARLHVACAILPNVHGERVFAWAEPFNFDAVLDILRSEFPSKHFVENFHGYRDLCTAEKAKTRAAQILRLMGKDGFTSLEESVLLNIDDLP